MNNHSLKTDDIHHQDQARKKNENNFFKQKVDFSIMPILFPVGFEKFFLIIYFIIFPYIAGLLFLFFYIAKGNLKVFFSLSSDASFIMTWAIGYEIIAALLLLWIIKSAISFTIKNANSKNKNKFHIPK